MVWWQDVEDASQEHRHVGRVSAPAVPPNGINGNPTSVVNRSLPDPVFLTVFVSSLSFVDAMMYQPPGRKIRMVDARLW